MFIADGSMGAGFCFGFGIGIESGWGGGERQEVEFVKEKRRDVKLVGMV